MCELLILLFFLFCWWRITFYWWPVTQQPYSTGHKADYGWIFKFFLYLCCWKSDAINEKWPFVPLSNTWWRFVKDGYAYENSMALYYFCPEPWTCPKLCYTEWWFLCWQSFIMIKRVKLHFSQCLYSLFHLPASFWKKRWKRWSSERCNQVLLWILLLSPLFLKYFCT